MLVAGLLVLLIAVLLLVAGLVGGTDPVSLDLGPVTLSTNATTVFLLGMLTLGLAVLGLWMVVVGLRHARNHRRDRRKVHELSQQLDENRKPTPGAGAHGSSTDPSSGEPTRAE